MKTLLVDNYDSFTHNLYQLVGALDAPPIVARNDKLTLEEVVALAPDRVILSPGPGSPEDPLYFGVGMAIIRALGPRVPILGVCLGHQGIALAYGGALKRAAAPMHGKTSLIHHDGDALFAGVPSPFEAMRYHSLIADPSAFPACLRIIARTDDGTIMALRHIEHPVIGVQFHPESIGTPDGRQIVANFLGSPTWMARACGWIAPSP